jgi:hypothetical protein
MRLEKNEAPLECEAIKNHKTTASHFVWLPGKDVATPVCNRHYDKLLPQATRWDWVKPGDAAIYRVEKAKAKSDARIRDEKFIYEATILNTPVGMCEIALQHAISVSPSGNPDIEAYFLKATELGLNVDEAKVHLPEAMKLHKKMTGKSSVVPIQLK